MAWIFSLSAECGTDHNDAKRIAQHFQDYDPVLEVGTHHPVAVGFQEIDGAWWVMCIPAGVTRTGISNAEDERITTQVGIKLYERLKTATGYRFAIVGVEVDGFRNYAEINCDDLRLDLSGLVLSESLWNRLHCPGVFVAFSPGYYWWPFTRAR